MKALSKNRHAASRRIAFALLMLVSGTSLQSFVHRRAAAIQVNKVKLPNDSGPPIEKVEFRRGGRVLLVHTLSEYVADCNSLTTEKGAYRLRGDSLVLYSSWDFSGQIQSPRGVQKQIFVADSAGRLVRRASLLHVEYDFEELPGYGGSRFLHQEPATDADRALFAKYVTGIEESFDGTFVFGKAAEALEREVRRRCE